MESLKDKKAEVKAKINQAPGKEQVLVTKDTAFQQILKFDKEGKYLVFDIIDFPELSRTQLSKLSPSARTAYQMDMRIAYKTGAKLANGETPFDKRIEIIDKNDPLSRGHSSMRKGQAKKLPQGYKHLNVGPHEVDELRNIGYRLAKPDEVEIVGAKIKDGAVVLTDNHGHVENVTMLVEEDKYQKHREIDRSKAEARLEANIEATKETMRQYAPKVTIYDKTELK